jgi:hypothetical protein
MSDYELLSPTDASKLLAHLFVGSGRCTLEATEDEAFGARGRLSLGEIKCDGDRGDSNEMFEAVTKGRLEWLAVTKEAAEAQLLALLDIRAPEEGARKDKKDAYSRDLDRVRRILNAVGATTHRLGLVHPSFDVSALEQMPFRRGSTVVADTSGVLQGGLSFVSRFLNPVARIKIPALVHMEALNLADNFLKRRRSVKAVNAGAMLFDHILSQTAQRVLLRLELRADTEVERTPLFGDPLRNAFQKDNEQEWPDLNLSVPFRSFCDRLILEAARQHQAASSPGHTVYLLTADQGLARMALAEGVAPLYFDASDASALFGQRLTATMFHPFTAEPYSVALHEILWDLAAAFGSVRLTATSEDKWVEITAMGKELTWTPVHSRNDLLWVRAHNLSPRESGRALNSRGGTDAKKAKPLTSQVEEPNSHGLTTKMAKSDVGGYYRFNVANMVSVVCALARAGGSMAEAKVLEIANAATPGEYKRFLVAGKLLDISGDQWTLTDDGLSLAAALLELDIASVANYLSLVPSVSTFFENLRGGEVGKPIEITVPDRAETTYKALGEIACMGANLANEGFFPTPAKPSLEKFAELALLRFNELAKGEPYVSAGEWLEAMVRHDGIHPVIARNALEEANAAALLTRSTEGSTTDTRHDSHSIRVLKKQTGNPTVDVVHLYRGDFLIPGKSSSSIRISEVAK